MPEANNKATPSETNDAASLYAERMKKHVKRHMIAGHPPMVAVALAQQSIAQEDEAQEDPAEEATETPQQEADEETSEGKEAGEKRSIPQSARDKMPAAEFAGPNETYPIAKPEDIAAAAKLVGKADNPDAVKARIIAIAKKHGWQSSLPQTWQDEMKDKTFGERLRAGLKALGVLKDEPEPEIGGFVVFKDANGQDRWTAFYSNNFEDRDSEFFREKGFDQYVARLDMGLVEMPELWSWHTRGTRYGEADWVDRIGHFHVATGTYDDTPAGRAGKAYDITHQKDYGVSHGFLYRSGDVEIVDGKKVYANWNTFEISPLPLHRAANELTAFAVELNTEAKEIEMDAEKRKHLAEKYAALGGEEYVAKLEALSESRGKEIEQLKGFKDFVHPDGDSEAAANKQALESADKAFGELMPQLMEDAGEAVSAALQAVKAAKEVMADNAAMRAELKSIADKVKLEYDGKPRRASQDAKTLVKEGDLLLTQSQLGSDEGLKEVLPGLFRQI